LAVVGRLRIYHWDSVEIICSTVSDVSADNVGVGGALVRAVAGAMARRADVLAHAMAVKSGIEVLANLVGCADPN
jgi:hypothetical protein